MSLEQLPVEILANIIICGGFSPIDVDALRRTSKTLYGLVAEAWIPIEQRCEYVLFSVELTPRKKAYIERWSRLFKIKVNCRNLNIGDFQSGWARQYIHSMGWDCRTEIPAMLNGIYQVSVLCRKEMVLTNLDRCRDVTVAMREHVQIPPGAFQSCHSVSLRCGYNGHINSPAFYPGLHLKRLALAYVIVTDLSSLDFTESLVLDNVLVKTKSVPFHTIKALELVHTRMPPLLNLMAIHTLRVRTNGRMPDLSPLINLRNLTVTGYSPLDRVSGLESLEYLRIEDNNHLLEISDLSVLHTLIVRKCRALSVISNIPRAKEVTLEDLPKLTTFEMPEDIRALSLLGDTPVQNISHCKTLRSLTAHPSCITGTETLNNPCTTVIEDVCILPLHIRIGFTAHFPSISAAVSRNSIPLCYLHKVTLCGDIDSFDLSCLGKVHSLNLSNSNITTAEGLGTCYSLDFSSCSKLIDVRDLGNVYRLILRKTAVTDVSVLTNVYDLNLHDTSIIDVSGCKNVRILDISHTNVVDVSMLLELHTLTCWKYGYIEGRDQVKCVLD